MNKLELQKMANEIRKGIITAVHSAKAGHPGGSLSATEAVSYTHLDVYKRQVVCSVDFLENSGKKRQRKNSRKERHYHDKRRIQRTYR